MRASQGRPSSLSPTPSGPGETPGAGARTLRSRAPSSPRTTADEFDDVFPHVPIRSCDVSRVTPMVCPHNARENSIQRMSQCDTGTLPSISMLPRSARSQLIVWAWAGQPPRAADVVQGDPRFEVVRDKSPRSRSRDTGSDSVPANNERPGISINSARSRLPKLSSIPTIWNFLAYIDKRNGDPAHSLITKEVKQQETMCSVSL